MNPLTHSDWIREGQTVTGIYVGTYKVRGVVIESRVKYGGMVEHRVEVYPAIRVFGSLRTSVLLDEDELILQHLTDGGVSVIMHS